MSHVYLDRRSRTVNPRVSVRHGRTSTPISNPKPTADNAPPSSIRSGIRLVSSLPLTPMATGGAGLRANEKKKQCSQLDRVPISLPLWSRASMPSTPAAIQPRANPPLRVFFSESRPMDWAYPRKKSLRSRAMLLTVAVAQRCSRKTRPAGL